MFLKALDSRSESRFDEFHKVKEAIVVAQALQLGGQLNDLHVCDPHLGQNLLHTVKLYHIFVDVLFGEESESVFDVGFFKLGIRLKREDIEKFVEVQRTIVLREHLSELLLLLGVRVEADHREDPAKGLLVNSFLLLRPVDRLGFQIEDLFEVLSVDFADAGLLCLRHHFVS